MYTVFIDTPDNRRAYSITRGSAYEASAVLNAYMDAMTGGHLISSDLGSAYEPFAMVTPAMFEQSRNGVLPLPI